VISTTSDLKVFRRKPFKVDLIDLSIHAWKTYIQAALTDMRETVYRIFKHGKSS